MIYRKRSTSPRVTRAVGDASDQITQDPLEAARCTLNFPQQQQQQQHKLLLQHQQQKNARTFIEDARAHSPRRNQAEEKTDLI